MATIDVQKNQEIGKRLKDARLERGFSQWQLCQKLGFKSTRILAKYENGTFPMPEDLVARCAKELGVAADYILEGEKMAMNTITMVPKPQIAVVKPDVVIPEKEEETEKKRTAKYSYSCKRTDYIWIRGDVLSENMKKAHLTNKEAAILVGAHNQEVVNGWRRGKNRINPEWAKILCEYFGITMDELVDKERNEKEPNKILSSIPPQLRKKEAESNETIKEEPKKEETAMPELVTVSDRPIPVNAEQIFCKNVKFYISERKLDENKFLEKVGASEKYLDDVIKHNYKIPMAVTLRIARELGISVEDLATDDKAFKIEQEILELEKRMKDLRAMIGIA